MLIILISTANIYTQYIRKTLFGEDGTLEHFDKTNLNISNEVYTTLFKADKLYEEQSYQEAATEYNSLLAGNKLTVARQKALAYFKLGMCNYKLQNYAAAKDGFIKAIDFGTADAVAYNNAAICFYYLKDYEKAREYEQKAISLTATVEFYYNMGRMFETIEDYDNAAKYYQGVIKGEDSITYDDLIDPVRIRNKVFSMVPDEMKRAELSKDVIIALRLKDMREVLLISDTDMTIKSFDFNWKIVKVSNGDLLRCSYDRDKLDPYHLIKSLSWTVKCEDRNVFKSSKENIEISIDKNLDYSVTLNIEYGNKTFTKTRLVNNNRIDEKGNKEEFKQISQADQVCKFYIYAIYEQLFEKDMKINKRGYTDRFGVVWGKDEIETNIIDKDFMDAQSALYIKNTLSKRAGVWADLSSLINDKQLENKNIRIKLYARKVSANANLYVSVRTKVGNTVKYTPKKYPLIYKWQQFDVDIPIRENTDGLTVSFRTDSGEEIKIDGFIITINK